MREVIDGIWAGLAAASALEQAATILGLAGVVLMARQNVWTFPISLVQVAIFGWVCFQGRLYSEAVLQAWFFAALVYGWIHWTRGRAADHPLPVRWLDRRARLLAAATVVGLWAVWGALMFRLGAALAYADALVFATSVVAQWLQARKVIENWIGWIFANTVAIGVFWVKAYYWFAFLYVVFWVLAWIGMFAWRRSFQARRAAGPAPGGAHG